MVFCNLLQLEGTKTIEERRKLRAELRTLKDKKEKLEDNHNNNRPSSVASKVTMTVGGSKKNEFQEKANRLNREESPTRKENVAPNQPKSAKSTYSFKMAKTEETPPAHGYTRRHDTNRVESNIEEKRPRWNKDVNNNTDEMNITKARNEPIKEKQREAESLAPPPQRMSRRASLAELFKIDQDAGAKPQVDGRATPTPIPQVQISAPPSQGRMPLESPKDMQTKKDLLQNLGQLRCRRRSVREIERKEELEGLMYVKSGDSVKLVNTSEGDEQVKEQRRIRRSSRKESYEKLKIEGNTVSELSAIEESPRSPTGQQSFGFERDNQGPQNKCGLPPNRQDAANVNRTWTPAPARDAGYGGADQPGKQWAPAPNTAPQRVQPPKPSSFLPSKNEVSFISAIKTVSSYCDS